MGRRPCRVGSQFRLFPESTPGIRGQGELTKIAKWLLPHIHPDRTVVGKDSVCTLLDAFFYSLIVAPSTSHDVLLAVLCISQAIYVQVFPQPYDRS